MTQPLFNIVLNAPDIPGNTGSIGRTCVALGARLILIKPYGFEITEKALRRAGLDYWKYVDLREYESFDEFIEKENPPESSLHFFSRFSKKSFYENSYERECYLIFGSETSGLPKELFSRYPERFITLPMFSEHIRSLNLSNTACAAAYEALRQINYQS
jgi:tRNA (cytidine/uridine-2'-O-)-methyltransferase